MTIGTYDVAKSPSPEEWLALDEGERILLVQEAHLRTRAHVGHSAEAHAAMHVAAENRLAEGHAVVVAAYERFRAAGVDRHNTIHALASVITRHMMAVLEQQAGFEQTAADRDFDALDPASWKPKPKPKPE